MSRRSSSRSAQPENALRGYLRRRLGQPMRTKVWPGPRPQTHTCPWFVFRRVLADNLVPEFSGPAIHVLHMEIESAGISARYQPSLDRRRQMQSPLAVREHPVDRKACGAELPMCALSHTAGGFPAMVGRTEGHHHAANSFTGSGKEFSEFSRGSRSWRGPCGLRHFDGDVDE
jgi:hypothetical protein